MELNRINKLSVPGIRWVNDNGCIASILITYCKMLP